MRANPSSSGPREPGIPAGASGEVKAAPYTTQPYWGKGSRWSRSSRKMWTFSGHSSRA